MDKEETEGKMEEEDIEERIPISPELVESVGAQVDGHQRHVGVVHRLQTYQVKTNPVDLKK